VIYAFGLLPATGFGPSDGQACGETLVPLHKPYVGQFFFQGVQSIQNFAGLKADLPPQRSRNADHDLRDALFADHPPQGLAEFRTRDYLKGTSDQAVGIGDGDARTHVSEVEGNDTPTGVCGGWQGLLLGTGEPLA